MCPTTSDYTHVSIINPSKWQAASDSIKPYRLDKLIALLWSNQSRAVIRKLIEQGHVWVDGHCQTRPCKSIHATKGLTIAVDFSSVVEQAVIDMVLPEPMSLSVVFEDDSIVIINKPAYQVVHPGHGNRWGTLQAGILHRYPQTVTLPRCGLVHRLDKDTSGLLVVAKTAQAQNNLIAQFKTRHISRHYLALVHGHPPPTGIIDCPIGRRRHDPLRMGVRSMGKEAITHFGVEKTWSGFSLLRCFLKTGRTHQIRVHLEHLGHPIVGDKQYQRGVGQQTLVAPRQLLHAAELSLHHPCTDKWQSWRCDLPKDMQQILNQLSEH